MSVLITLKVNPSLLDLVGMRRRTKPRIHVKVMERRAR